LKYGKGLTTGDVYNHVSRPAFTPFIDANRTVFACIDGRDESYVVSTPGGDAAEFIVAMTVFERYGGQLPLPGMGWNASVYWYLSDFLYTHDTFRPQMYMHTDEHSAERLAHSVGSDLLEMDMLNPPPHLLPALMAQVTNSSHVGCGHIRLMMSHPEIYGVPTELPKAMVIAFYDFLWYNDSSRLVLDILEFNHVETAVLQVTSTVERCGGPNYAPMVHPKINNSLFFVDHPQAVLVRRQQFAQYFAAKIGMPVDAFVDEMTHLAVQQLQLTVAVLASTLPIIQIEFVDLIQEELLAVDISLVLIVLGVISLIVKFPHYSYEFLLWTGICVRDTGGRVAGMVEDEIHLLQDEWEDFTAPVVRSEQPHEMTTINGNGASASAPNTGRIGGTPLAKPDRDPSQIV